MQEEKIFTVVENEELEDYDKPIVIKELVEKPAITINQILSDINYKRNIVESKQREIDGLLQEISNAEKLVEDIKSNTGIE